MRPAPSQLSPRLASRPCSSSIIHDLTHRILYFTSYSGGWGKTLAFGAVTWFLGGKFHSKRAVSKANKKSAQERKELYAQYYKDVLALQTQNAELAQYIDESSKRQLDSEFEAADIDHDNKVSRAEFNMYKNSYLQKHPEMASQFPKFEDFDPDSNGLISKDEYDAYYRKLQYA